jgi:hypothetical protein
MSTEHIYRAAVALNNIGVSLLEAACYDQALVTMLDAFTVIKVACSPAKQERHDICDNYGVVQVGSASPSTSEINSKLRRAYESHSCRRDSTQCQQPTTVVRAISDDPSTSDLDAVVRNAYEHDPGERGKVCAIRLDSASLDFPTDASGMMECDGHPQVEAAFHCNIVLHNLGLAYLCLSRSCDDARSVALSQKGVTLLHLCDQVLVTLSEQTSQKLHEFRRVLFLGMISTLSYRHFTGPSPALDQRIESIREGIHRINSSCFDCGIVTHSPSCAAAA